MNGRAIFHTSLILALYGVAACGGGNGQHAETTAHHAGGDAKGAGPGVGEGRSDHHSDHGEHHKDESKLPAPVREFHKVLAPLWHDKSPERTAKTCAQAATLKEKAAATGDAALVSATDELVAECGKDGRPQFEAKFKVVHEKFHALAEH